MGDTSTPKTGSYGSTSVANAAYAYVYEFHVICIALLLATIANGLYTWLWTTQIIDSEIYRNYLVNLRAYLAAGKFENFQHVTHGLFSSLFTVPGGWLITKATKDIFFLVFAIISVTALVRRQALSIPASRLATVLLLWLLMAFFHSWYVYGFLPPVLGSRQFLFLIVAFLGSWMVGNERMEQLAKYLLVLLLVQFALALYENFHGMGLFHSMRIGNRVSGTFTFPTSLGIFAAVGFVFIAQFSQINRLVLFALASGVVFMTGSGTGFVLLGLSGVYYLSRLFQPNVRAWALIALGAVAIMLFTQMPQLLSRPTLFDSVFGRVLLAESHLERQQFDRRLLLGYGLGVGSNVLNSVRKQSTLLNETDFPRTPADSTPMALLHQVGLVGFLLFYLMMGTAAWRDRKSRPVIAVILLGSLTINITELFPVNFLLGLLLCHSFMQRANAG